MSCFLLPKKICDELTSLIRQFWWGQGKDHKKLVWLSWDKLCMPKAMRGMGFKDLRLFNLALLAKQGWRLQTNSTSLFAWVFKVKYFPHCSFLEAELGRHPSYAWRSIMAAQGVVQRGTRCQIGLGECVRAWCDKWIPKSTLYSVVTREDACPNVTLVCDLINRASMEWKAKWIQGCFTEEDADAILSIPLSLH